jgi:hypothetical protein
VVGRANHQISHTPSLWHLGNCLRSPSWLSRSSAFTIGTSESINTGQETLSFLAKRRASSLSNLCGVGAGVVGRSGVRVRLLPTMGMSDDEALFVRLFVLLGSTHGDCWYCV